MASSTHVFGPLPLKLERWPQPLRRATTVLAGIYLAIVLFTALFANFLAPHPYDKVDLRNQLAAPSAAHPLGTDFHGRDVLSRLIYGSRVSLSVALLVEGVELLFGLTLG